MRAHRPRVLACGVASPCRCCSWSRPCLGGFFRIPPPHGRERRRAVFRQRILAAETVPARGTAFIQGKLRNRVVVPKQHAVERPGGGGTRGKDGDEGTTRV